ncbi:ribose-phosphate pyrophosphokinase [Sphingomonas mesophila]|uniref:ribose-phosphate pyrophosphokinase n=1 Tax=Sphingomonas mesophila TaxID=2303576 RepID=UPI000E56EB3C|nr:ribose-phosphate pyrophosphokinase [Sphingomonas mesophila]
MRLADAGEVRAHLIAAARAGTAVTYSELLGQLGYPFSRPRMRSLCKTLEAVDAEAAGRGEPELAVLVVRQSDGLPGQGWWIGQDGRWEGPEARRRIERLQGAAFAYWSEG